MRKNLNKKKIKKKLVCLRLIIFPNWLYTLTTLLYSVPIAVKRVDLALLCVSDILVCLLSSWSNA